MELGRQVHEPQITAGGRSRYQQGSKDSAVGLAVLRAYLAIVVCRGVHHLRSGPSLILYMCIYIYMCIYTYMVKEKVTQNSYSGWQIHCEPPCVTQGAGDCPEGIAPSRNPLAKFAQQELLYPRGRWLVEGSLSWCGQDASWQCRLFRGFIP